MSLSLAWSGSHIVPLTGHCPIPLHSLKYYFSQMYSFAPMLFSISSLQANSGSNATTPLILEFVFSPYLSNQSDVMELPLFSSFIQMMGWPHSKLRKSKVQFTHSWCKNGFPAVSSHASLVLGKQRKRVDESNIMLSFHLTTSEGKKHLFPQYTL